MAEREITFCGIKRPLSFLFFEHYEILKWHFTLRTHKNKTHHCCSGGNEKLTKVHSNHWICFGDVNNQSVYNNKSTANITGNKTREAEWKQPQALMKPDQHEAPVMRRHQLRVETSLLLEFYQHMKTCDWSRLVRSVYISEETSASRWTVSSTLRHAGGQSVHDDRKRICKLTCRSTSDSSFISMQPVTAPTDLH